MENKDQKPPQKLKEANEKSFPGYPIYPESEDIYAKAKHVRDPDPDDYPGLNTRPEDYGKLNEKDFDDDVSGDDLDVPGSELDDYQEEIGSEDEENNYYSLGGDSHEDLEEDRGE